MNSPTERTDSGGGTPSVGLQGDLDLLRRLPLLKGVDPECLRILAMLCKRLDFLKGDILINQGETNDFAFIIISGDLETVVEDNDGEQILTNHGPGQTVCFTNLLGQVVSVISLRAATNIQVLRLHRKEFIRSLEQFPGSINRVISNLVGELVSWDQKMLTVWKEKNKTGHPNAFGISLL